MPALAWGVVCLGKEEEQEHLGVGALVSLRGGGWGGSCRDICCVGETRAGTTREGLQVRAEGTSDEQRLSICQGGNGVSLLCGCQVGTGGVGMLGGDVLGLAGIGRAVRNASGSHAASRPC